MIWYLRMWSTRCAYHDTWHRQTALATHTFSLAACTVWNASPPNFHLALLLIYFQAQTENFHCHKHAGTAPAQMYLRSSWHCRYFVIVIVVLLLLQEWFIKWMNCYHGMFSIIGYNLHVGVHGEPLPVTSEQDVFDYIGMDYKEPHERNMWQMMTVFLQLLPVSYDDTWQYHCADCSVIASYVLRSSFLFV